jgi:uncharacterized DUF497 family protein
MKCLLWNNEKNEELKRTRGISFEEVGFHIQNGDILDIAEHHNNEKYKNQQIYIVKINNYVYLVPFVEEKEYDFLKTIIPSSKATKRYLGGGKKNGKSK